MCGAEECKYRSQGCFRVKCNMLALELLLTAYLNAEMELTFNGRRIVENKKEKKSMKPSSKKRPLRSS
jgi:hypothetical protein